MGKSEVRNSELFKVNERTEHAALDKMKVKNATEVWKMSRLHRSFSFISRLHFTTSSPEVSDQPRWVNKPVFTSGAHETPGGKLITEA